MYTTYHYGDQDIADHGWGCSYRNIQTLSSAFGCKQVPTIPDLLSFFDLSLPKHGARGGKDLWIEPPQVARALRSLCKIQSTTLVHAPSLKDFEQMFMLRSTLKDFDARLENQPSDLVARIDQHFKVTQGLPIIIDDGICSYVLAPGEGSYYTMIDPHVLRGASGCVRKFKRENLLSERSGWMLLFPERKKK